MNAIQIRGNYCIVFSSEIITTVHAQICPKSPIIISCSFTHAHIHLISIKFTHRNDLESLVAVVSTAKKSFQFPIVIIIGGLRGRPLPNGTRFFHFSRLDPQRGERPPQWEILDPHLIVLSQFKIGFLVQNLSTRVKL